MKKKAISPIHYILDNPDNDEYLNKYNEIMSHNNGESLHHIKPRCKYPDLKDDKANHVYLTLEDHYIAHYYLWKSNRIYALEFWFTYSYFHKYYGFSITENEYNQLKEDCTFCRKLKKQDMIDKKEN